MGAQSPQEPPPRQQARCRLRQDRAGWLWLPCRGIRALSPRTATRCSCWESGTTSSWLASQQQQKYTAFLFNSSFWRKKAYHIASLIEISSPYFLILQIVSSKAERDTWRESLHSGSFGPRLAQLSEHGSPGLLMPD